MNWALFVIVLFISLILEMSLFPLLEIAGARPGLVAILATCIALSASRASALWGCFLCGVMIDLTSPVAFDAGRSVHLIGPHALGFTFACLLILQVRGMVMRRQIFATAVMAGVFVAAAAVVTVAVYTLRSWYSPEFAGFSPLGMLLHRLLSAIYTGLFAVPVAWLLLRRFEMWRFPATTPARPGWR